MSLDNAVLQSRTSMSNHAAGLKGGILGGAICLALSLLCDGLTTQKDFTVSR